MIPHPIILIDTIIKRSLKYLINIRIQEYNMNTEIISLLNIRLQQIFNSQVLRSRHKLGKKPVTSSSFNPRFLPHIDKGFITNLPPKTLPQHYSGIANAKPRIRRVRTNIRVQKCPSKVISSFENVSHHNFRVSHEMPPLLSQ